MLRECGFHNLSGPSSIRYFVDSDKNFRLEIKMFSSSQSSCSQLKSQAGKHVTKGILPGGLLRFVSVLKK